MKNKKFEGKITIAGKAYECQVLSGICYVKLDGQWVTTEQLLSTLPAIEAMKFAMLGAMKIDADARGEQIPLTHIYNGLSKPTN